MKVSFDFDDTLAEWVGIPKKSPLRPKDRLILLLKHHYKNGDICVILTARNDIEAEKNEILTFLKNNYITEISEIIFTNHNYKGKFVLEHGIDLHYDDDEEHLESIREVGVNCVNSLTI
jgi:acid phosphatase class B